VVLSPKCNLGNAALGTALATFNPKRATPAELAWVPSVVGAIQAGFINCDPTQWSAQVRDQISECRKLLANPHFLSGPPKLVVHTLAMRFTIPEFIQDVPGKLNKDVIAFIACEQLLPDILRVLRPVSVSITHADVTLPAVAERTRLPFSVRLLSTGLENLPGLMEIPNTRLVRPYVKTTALEFLQMNSDEEWSVPGERRVRTVIAKVLGASHPALGLLFQTTRELGLSPAVCDDLAMERVGCCEIRRDALCWARDSSDMPVLNGWGIFLMSAAQLRTLQPQDIATLQKHFIKAGF